MIFKMAKDTLTQSGATTTQPPSKPASMFDDDGMHLTVFTPRAVARVTAALQAIETLSGILFKRHEEAEWEDDSPPVDPLDTRGILSAISVCSTFAHEHLAGGGLTDYYTCLLYTSPSPRDRTRSRMPSSA